MFYEWKDIETIPFDINMKGSAEMGYMFYNCTALKEAPRIYNGGFSYSATHMFAGCENIREFPEDYFGTWTIPEVLKGADNMFSGMRSLRKLPTKVISVWQSGYDFSGCYFLDEITGLGVITYTTPIKNNFSGAFNRCYRMKNLTFKLNSNGTPIKAQWTNQTIDLTQDFAYYRYSNALDYFNSGITADKEVKDDATYAELKYNPDWYATKLAYSRYNKTSAIATIKSLPDCAEYVDTKGGTNTIKFNGYAGSKTDGGAINTMTEAEIAVATAKGWTVSFV